MKPFFILLLISQYSFAQTFEVFEVDKAFTSGKKRIQNGQSLTLDDTITVKSGELRFRLKNRWVFVKKEGTFILDTVYKHYLKKHFTHDSICDVLDSLDLLHCGFPYKVDCIYIGNKKETDFIAFPSNQLKTNTSLVNITWKHPEGENYKGYYYLKLMDFGEEYIQLIKTDQQELSLELPNPSKYDGLYLAKIISEECRESQLMAILFKE